MNEKKEHYIVIQNSINQAALKMYMALKMVTKSTEYSCMISREKSQVENAIIAFEKANKSVL